MHQEDSREDRFRYLYGRYYRQIVRFYMRNRVSSDEAEDLAQDTFVRFYETLNEYRGEAEWAYLEVIAQRVLYNRIRSLHTLKRASDVESLEASDKVANMVGDPNVDEDFFSAEDRLLGRETAAILKSRLAAAIQSLPRGMQQCLLLWLEGRNYAEIAQMLRISNDAVKSRIRDARMQLRETLSDLAADEWSGAFVAALGTWDEEIERPRSSSISKKRDPFA